MVGIGRTVTPGDVMSSRNTLMPARVGVTRPDLLAIDDEVVAAVLGACAQGREVGSGVRFGEQLGEDDVAACHAREELVTLRSRAEAHDERADVVEVHVLRASGLLVSPHLLAQHRLHPDARVPTAVLLGPGHREPPTIGELAADLSGEGHGTVVVDEHAAPPVGELLGEERAQLGAELLLFRGELEVHGWPGRQRSDRTIPPSTVKQAPVIQEP
jgi:hypothetical protein